MEAKTNHHLHGVGVQYVRERLVEAGYGVRSRPSGRGFSAIDLIAVDKEGGTFGIKVRAKSSGGGGWRLTEKEERFTTGTLFYYLIDTGENIAEKPYDVYVIPASVVARYVSLSHSAWLRGCKANEDPRKDSEIRYLSDPVRSGLGDAMLSEYPDGWLEHYKQDWHPGRAESSVLLAPA